MNYVLATWVSDADRIIMSECFMAPTRFYEQYVLRRNSVNDAKGYYFEHMLYDAVVDSPFKIHITLWPFEVEGISGSSGFVYTQPRLSMEERLQYMRNRLVVERRNSAASPLLRVWYGGWAFVVRAVKALWPHAS